MVNFDLTSSVLTPFYALHNMRAAHECIACRVGLKCYIIWMVCSLSEVPAAMTIRQCRVSVNRFVGSE